MNYDRKITRRLFTAASNSRMLQMLLIFAAIGVVSFLAGYLAGGGI